MSKLLTVAFTASFLLFLPLKAFADPQPYSANAIQQIKQNYLGQKWLMLLWSVDCPPCFKELALIQKIRQQHKNINIVIVNADDNDEVATQRKQVIEKYQLEDLAHFHFNDGQGDRERYQIDPNWYGELPRSYFVDAQGKFHGKSGLIDEQLLTTWLIAPTK